MRYFIKVGQLIDGVSAMPKQDVTVVVDNDTIAEVRETAITAGEGEQYLDLSHETLMPGIIDAHVHLCLDGTSSDPMKVRQSQTQEQLLLSMASRARALLMSGVTTARDCGSENYLDWYIKRAIDSGELLGPRMYTCGQAITTTGGHGWTMGGIADTAEEARKVARENLQHGADFIKIMATGGGTNPEGIPGVPSCESQYSFEELRFIAEEVHRYGKTVAAHAHGIQGITDCIRAGVDSIEHFFWMTEGDIPTVVPQDILNEMVSRGTYVCPTVCTGLDEIEARNPKMIAVLLENWRNFYKAGGALVFGTDAGIPNVAITSWPRGLVWMPRIGLSPMQAISSATIVPARLLGVDDFIGSVEGGKIADLIAVTNDPLADLLSLEHPAFVMKNGQVVRNRESGLIESLRGRQVVDSVPRAKKRWLTVGSQAN